MNSKVEKNVTAPQKSNRRTKTGTVVSNKMKNTVVVKVERTFRHPEYEKVITRAKKFYAHHDDQNLNIGDVVTIIETRPLSKLKRWRVAAN